MFSDMLAISPVYLMSITKHPSRKATTTDRRAEKFIQAGPERASDPEDEGRFIQTPVRFPKSLLARIDQAAKRKGLNRTSWLRYAATKELDQEEL